MCASGGKNSSAWRFNGVVLKLVNISTRGRPGLTPLPRVAPHAQGLINVRNKKLESLVNAAAGPAVPQPHSRTSALDRIDLREEACMGSGAGAGGEADALGNGPPIGSLPEITEDGAEGAGKLRCRLCRPAWCHVA